VDPRAAHHSRAGDEGNKGTGWLVSMGEVDRKNNREDGSFGRNSRTRSKKKKTKRRTTSRDLSSMRFGTPKQEKKEDVVESRS